MSFIGSMRPLQAERLVLADRLKAIGFKTAALNVLDGAYVADFATASEACDRYAADPAVYRDVEMSRWCRAPVTLTRPAADVEAAALKANAGGSRV